MSGGRLGFTLPGRFSPSIPLLLVVKLYASTISSSSLDWNSMNLSSRPDEDDSESESELSWCSGHFYVFLGSLMKRRMGSVDVWWKPSPGGSCASSPLLSRAAAASLPAASSTSNSPTPMSCPHAHRDAIASEEAYLPCLSPRLHCPRAA